jgi:cytochrome c
LRWELFKTTAVEILPFELNSTVEVCLMAMNRFFLPASVLAAAFVATSVAAYAGGDKPAPEAPVAAQPAAEKADAGQMLFNNCRTCHATKAGDNRLGPSLAGLRGRKAGSVEGFNYSPAMKGAGITWDEKTLDAFIANPDAIVPGHNMKPYTGMTSAEDRSTIVSFLRGGGS